MVDSEMIPYTWCNREIVTEYAHYDIVLTLETFLTTAPVALARGNMCGIELENSLIYPLLDMERVGFANKDYVLKAQVSMKEYIIRRRNELAVLCGESFSIAQHNKVLNVLQEKFNLHISSTREMKNSV